VGRAYRWMPHPGMHLLHPPGPDRATGQDAARGRRLPPPLRPGAHRLRSHAPWRRDNTGAPRQPPPGGWPVPAQRPTAVRDGLRPVRHARHPDPHPGQPFEGVPARRHPALTADRATGAVGLAQGVTADHADEIFMPSPQTARGNRTTRRRPPGSQTTRSTSTINATGRPAGAGRIGAGPPAPLPFAVEPADPAAHRGRVTVQQLCDRGRW
jgi:hypothetical protein